MHGRGCILARLCNIFLISPLFVILVSVTNQLSQRDKQIVYRVRSAPRWSWPSFFILDQSKYSCWSYHQKGQGFQHLWKSRLLSKYYRKPYKKETTAPTIAVVSNEYHLYCTKFCAKKLGYSVYTIVAPTFNWLLTINYFIREAPAVVKTWLTS